MKKITNGALAILMVLMLSGMALAVDLTALDQVSVSMTRSEVLALLGNPDDVVDAGRGLKAEVYKVADMMPMVGAGCIYQDDQRLAGQAFIFQGKVGKEAVERLLELGFALMEEQDGTFRLLGKDDDTGRPLVAHIAFNDGMTVIMTFEKGFYDQRVK
ncbi:MAG: hypothetical protein PHO83_15295 [Geobacteraceae bacterium]|nr:hypothetical protein [Geobacteraceae bacterium]